MRKGSIAIFSNSGNFTTTIATYLRMAGWGTTTLISSGKDVYIHYAAPEFAFALANDARTKAAVLYAEPGGYYELDADFNKPIVACVVGRWKAKLTRAVGHAGAMAGGSDDALAKERWFMDKFGADGIFTPERPDFLGQGRSRHEHRPYSAGARCGDARERHASGLRARGHDRAQALVRREPGHCAPADIDIPVVEAVAPYNEQIGQLSKQIGAVVPRQNMKDASGASQMDAKTQVTSLHAVSMLEAAQYPLEANVCLALLHEPGGENDRKLLNVAIGAELNLHGDPALAAAQAARDAGNAPNSVLAAAASIIGPVRAQRAREAMHAMIDRFAEAGLSSALDPTVDVRAMTGDAAMAKLFATAKRDAKAEAMLAGLEARGATSVFIRYLETLDGHPTADGVLAAIATTLAWGPLMHKRISRLTAESLPWWIRLFGALIGASVAAERHEPGRFCGIPECRNPRAALARPRSRTLPSSGSRRKPANLFAFQTLVGLLLTEWSRGDLGAGRQGGGLRGWTGDARAGPAQQGARRLPDPFRLYAWRQRLRGHRVPASNSSAIPILPIRRAGIMASISTRSPLRYVDEYARYKTTKKSAGSLDIQKIPGVNHPVFKDRPVNLDPREVFIRELFDKRGEYNVFHDYYRALVQALFDAGVSRNVYCVNIDAVIAALLLKILWQPYRTGAFPEQAMETAAFTIFLYPRMLGCAAEVDDHLNRGRNMDTRTPASQCRFVA